MCIRDRAKGKARLSCVLVVILPDDIFAFGIKIFLAEIMFGGRVRLAEIESGELMMIRVSKNAGHLACLNKSAIIVLLWIP